MMSSGNQRSRRAARALLLAGSAMVSCAGPDANYDERGAARANHSSHGRSAQERPLATAHYQEHLADADDSPQPLDSPTAEEADKTFPRSEDPGRGSWKVVPKDEVRARCKLDPELLAAADRKLGAPYLIVRYGQICHQFRVDEDAWPSEALSLTKTFAAAVVGRVIRATRSLPRTGPRTGPFHDSDRVDAWLPSTSYNLDAHVAHVLGMVAHEDDLALGQKKMEYDYFGNVQINTLSEMLNAAIAQRPRQLGRNLDDFTQRFVFEPLGMRDSSWTLGLPNKLFAFTWNTTMHDMARLGLLVLHGGSWSGERLLDPDYVYRMTHPAFEDANTGWGYLTWLNASSNHHLGTLPGPEGWEGVQQQARLPGPCAPVAVHAAHPHGLSEAPDCNYESPYSCDKEYDVGVWQGIGINGKVIQGHPGLDLLLVADNLTPLTFGPTAPALLWDAVRPALVAADPRFAGDEPAFCEAYGQNRYAPDLTPAR